MFWSEAKDLRGLADERTTGRVGKTLRGVNDDRKFPCFLQDAEDDKEQA